jgi:hypothetical protein
MPWLGPSRITYGVLLPGADLDFDRLEVAPRRDRQAGLGELQYRCREVEGIAAGLGGARISLRHRLYSD